jgi:hypothetical protein
VLCNQDILVLDSQKPIVVGVLRTQLKGEVDTLSTRCVAGGNVGSGGDVAIEVMLSLPTFVTAT